MIFKIAFRNLFRNARRTALTAGAVWISVFILIFASAFIGGVEESTVAVLIKTDSGLARVGAKGYFVHADDLDLDAVLKNDEAAAFRKAFAGKFPSDRAVARITFRADVTDGRFTARVRGLGVEPSAYFQNFKMALKSGSFSMPDTILGIPVWMGASLANDFGAKVGDAFTLTAKTRHGSYTANTFVLQGIVEAGNPVVDFNTVFLPLSQAQALLDMTGEVTEIILSGDRRNKSESFNRWARENFPGLDLRDWVDESRPIRELSTIRRKAMRVLLAGILLIALSGIANTMLIACFERKKEIGMMKALGLSVGPLVRMILIEGILIGIFGAILGFSTAWPICVYFEKRGIDLGDMLASSGSVNVSMATRIFLFPTAALALRAFLTGVVVAALATLYPAWKTAKTDPLEAIR